MTSRALFLWHMHQPDYRDPESGRPLLPWVRLHACRAYTDMAAMLERFPSVRAVVNWAPCLLLQLEDYVAGEAVDRDEELARKEAGALSPDERAQVLSQSFSVDWDLWVKPVARYRELLDKRGLELKQLDLRKIQADFSSEELTDLQVHFALAWMGFTARNEEPLVQQLLAKERGFTEAEKIALLDLQRAIARRVVPRWKALRERGQIEITCSPLFHPILPLLIDSDVARRAQPQLPLPPRFAFPDDARLQVSRGLDVAERTFGARPIGMWPSEGSVSPEVIELLAQEGLRWCATDQGILERSERAADPAARGPLHLRPWAAGLGDRFAIFFRDRDTSDAVGFRYARASAEDGANDLIGRIANQPEGALMTIALDGENAWEHYPGSGEAFLRALYEKLASEARVRTVLPGEELGLARGAAPGAALRDRVTRLHSGSWIDSNYRIWIGHPEDNAGWTLLGQARGAIARAEAEGRLSRAQLDQARDALLPAEGSDWFWWYGDDFHTDNAAEFDALFRRHVGAAFRALGATPPEALGRPIISPAKDAAAALDEHQAPRSLIAPAIDGATPGYFEWTGAGSYRPGRAVGGSMHQGQSGFGVLWFGFGSRERDGGEASDELFLRLDPREAEIGATSLRLRLSRARKASEPSPDWTPSDEAGQEIRELSFAVAQRGPQQPVLDAAGRPCGHGRSGAIVEIAVQLRALGLVPQDRFGLRVRAMRGEVEFERLPRYGEIALAVPGHGFEAAHWQV